MTRILQNPCRKFHGSFDIMNRGIIHCLLIPYFNIPVYIYTSNTYSGHTDNLDILIPFLYLNCMIPPSQYKFTSILDIFFFSTKLTVPK